MSRNARIADLSPTAAKSQMVSKSSRDTTPPVCAATREQSRQRGYRPQQAHSLALERRQKGVPRITGETWAVVERLLRQDWSPEQISGRLKKEQKVCISHEWIYQHILADKQAGGDLYRHLHCQKKCRKRYGKYDRRGKLPNCHSIEERPASVHA